MNKDMMVIMLGPARALKDDNARNIIQLIAEVFGKKLGSPGSFGSQSERRYHIAEVISKVFKVALRNTSNVFFLLTKNSSSDYLQFDFVTNLPIIIDTAQVFYDDVVVTETIAATFRNGDVQAIVSVTTKFRRAHNPMFKQMISNLTSRRQNVGGIGAVLRA